MTEEVVNPDWDSEENLKEGLVSDLGHIALVWEDGVGIEFLHNAGSIDDADFVYGHHFGEEYEHTYRPFPGKTEKVERWFARKRLQWPNLEQFLILPENEE